jgi:tetratricopeptide (TPR) repeat protein
MSGKSDDPRKRAVRRVVECMLGAVMVALSGCGGVSDRLHARLELKKGNENYLAGNYAGAIEHYNAAVARVPTLSRAYLNRAYSHEALFRASESLDERRALADSAATAFFRYSDLVEAGHRDGDTAPGRERIDEHVLTLYLDSLQPQKASALLESRLQSHPNDMATVQMLANLALERSDLEEALRWHRKRVELKPDAPEGHVAMAVMAWQFSNSNLVTDSLRTPLLDEGVRSAERAIELKPDYFEALVYANLLFREKAKYAESDAQRAEYEKKYAEYQERARQVGAQQKKDGVTPGDDRTEHGGTTRATG